MPSERCCDQKTKGSDPTMTDILSLLREQEARARASGLSKAEKARLLRAAGWKRVSSSGTERWMSRDGQYRTLSGAAAVQIACDLEAS
jgi:hypothetical protein